jgi:hypothetical protein
LLSFLSGERNDGQIEQNWSNPKLGFLLSKALGHGNAATRKRYSLFGYITFRQTTFGFSLYSLDRGWLAA